MKTIEFHKQKKGGVVLKSRRKINKGLNIQDIGFRVYGLGLKVHQSPEIFIEA